MSIGTVGYNYNVINHHNKYMNYINNSFLDFIYVKKKENIIISIYKKFNILVVNHVYKCILIFWVLLLVYTTIISVIKTNGEYKFFEKGLCVNL